MAHDGQEACTTGLAKRAEAIDVQVLPQGRVPTVPSVWMPSRAVVVVVSLMVSPLGLVRGTSFPSVAP